MLPIIVLIAWAITVGTFYENYKEKQNTFLETELRRFEGEVNSTLIAYEEFANYMYDEINQNDEILSILSQANSASDAGKEVFRERLLNKVAK